MKKLSVIICTHDPRRDYLDRTLRSLQEQTFPRGQWELLLVDNASQQALGQTCDLSWHPLGRHVREEELGLTRARVRGINESTGELLIFVDDDNVLAPSYLDHAAKIPVAYPHIGVFGAGVLEPEFEVQPSPELVPLLPLLALRTVVRPIWSNNYRDFSCIPWGAGLCVPKYLGDEYCTVIQKMSSCKVLDRRGKRLFSGGDDLFSWVCVGKNKGFGIFPDLRITHLISAGRLNQQYFVRWMHDHRFSHGVLKYLLQGEAPKRVDLFRKAHILLHGVRNGRFSMSLHWASARGETGAADFITENQLKPLPSGAADFKMALRTTQWN